MKIKITNVIDERQLTDYVLSKNPYTIKHISAVELKQSTSADGWKYHKRNKK